MSKLYSKIAGQGRALIILHGLFGSSRNWQSIAGRLSDAFRVVLIDQRNHGQSFHSKSHTYENLSDDLATFLEQEAIHEAFLVGHSMGGKTAMTFALAHPEKVRKLIVVDISPRAYPSTHDQLMEALCALDLRSVGTLAEADVLLEASIPDSRTRKFLLTNLRKGKDGVFEWRMNLAGLRSEYREITKGIQTDRPLRKPVLFLRGEYSNYVDKSDTPLIMRIFPLARIVTVPGAGHWVHADAPAEFVTLVRSFLVSSSKMHR